MDAADLHGSFRLGEWLVEPRHSRLSGPAGQVVLEPPDLALLLTLAASHGEAVGRAALRRAAWPMGGGTDQQLRQRIRRLRELLGGSARDRRYIVGADLGGFALIAHVEPLKPSRGAPPTDAERSVPRSPAGRVQAFIVELQAPQRLQGGRRVPRRHVDHAAGRGGDLRAAAPAASGG